MTLLYLVERTRNLVAQGDAREGKWRANRRVEWVASSLALCLRTRCIQHYYHYYRWCAHLGCQQSNELTSPRRFKWTRPFRRKPDSGFCACAITFRVRSTFVELSDIQSESTRLETLCFTPFANISSDTAVRSLLALLFLSSVSSPTVNIRSCLQEWCFITLNFLYICVMITARL